MVKNKQLKENKITNTVKKDENQKKNLENPFSKLNTDPTTNMRIVTQELDFGTEKSSDDDGKEEGN